MKLKKSVAHTAPWGYFEVQGVHGQREEPTARLGRRAQCGLRFAAVARPPRRLALPQIWTIYLPPFTASLNTKKTSISAQTPLLSLLLCFRLKGKENNIHC